MPPRVGAAGGVCTCVKRHVPPVLVTELHHVLPQSWGGADNAPDSIGPGVNRIEVCPTTHINTHLCLNEYVRAQGTPPASVLKRFPAVARDLAARGWLHRIPGHPTPYW